jgi:hypothetical protein
LANKKIHFKDEIYYLKIKLIIKITNKRDIYEYNYNFDIIRDEYENKIHIRKQKWWFMQYYINYNMACACGL